MDNWLAFFCRSRPSQFGANCGIHRAPAPAGALPAPVAYPAEGYAWVNGHWAPQGGRYQWVAGRWDRPPYQGARWTRARYEHHQQGWQVHEGHWDRDEHGQRRDH
jgi:WXXGXW repeat (2 copies)